MTTAISTRAGVKLVTASAGTIRVEDPSHVAMQGFSNPFTFTELVDEGWEPWTVREVWMGAFTNPAVPLDDARAGLGAGLDECVVVGAVQGRSAGHPQGGVLWSSADRSWR